MEKTRGIVGENAYASAASGGTAGKGARKINDKYWLYVLLWVASD